MGLFDPATATLPASNTVIADTQIPDWVSQAGQDVYATARGLADTEYQPYTGPRIANLSGTEQQAGNALQGAVGGWNPALGSAGAALGGYNQLEGQFDSIAAGQNLLNDPRQQGYLDSAGANIGRGETSIGQASREWDQSAADQYQSPFTQNVTDITARDMNRQYNQQAIRDNSAAAAGGAFGGTRHAMLNAENEFNRNQNLSDMYAKSNQQAYENAQGIFTSDQARQLQAGQAYGQLANANLGAYDRPVSAANQVFAGAGQGFAGIDRYGQEAQRYGELGSTQQKLGLQDASALQQYGALERSNEQASYDTAYNDYLEQREYPYRNVNFALGALKGSPYETRTTSQSAGNQSTLAPSAAGQLAGAAAAGVGALKYFGG